MSHTVHAHLTADERAERRARRRPIVQRRQSTRYNVIRSATLEA